MKITDTLIILLLLLIFARKLVHGEEKENQENNYDPCCSLPCNNNGICYTNGFKDYLCDCTGTGYYGSTCEQATFGTKVKKFVKPSRKFLQHFLSNYKPFWDFVNSKDWLKKPLMRVVLKIRTGFVSDPSPYIGVDEYTTWASSTNRSVYARTLPPIPLNCPTPMGVKGPKELPDPWMIAKKFLLRKEFRPCTSRTNVIFPMFAQHFTHQFFKTNTIKGLPFQWGEHNVDLSHVYGNTPERQLALRSLKHGKMKMSQIHGEDFPPLEANVTGASGFNTHFLEPNYRFIFGHAGFTLMPSFLLFSTLWLREHNYICEILKKEHPEWDDERLYQTARLIVTGETIKIVIEDYVQHLSGFHYKLIYDPEIMHGQSLSYHNQIHAEFQSLYHWHALIPDLISLDEKVYEIKDIVFNPKPLVDVGIAGVIRNFNRQFAGKVAGRGNQGSATIAVAVQAIKDGRKLRFQSLNKYRIKFDLKPYENFLQLTGDEILAKELEEAYGNIDALELFVGLMLEKKRDRQLFGEAITEMGSPYSLKGLYGNPISSPAWWKPVTFGGQIGFNLIKTASLQSLVCRNVNGCPKIAFSVPKDINYKKLEPPKPVENTKDDTSSLLMTITRHISGGEKFNNSRSSWISHPLYDLKNMLHIQENTSSNPEFKKRKDEL